MGFSRGPIRILKTPQHAGKQSPAPSRHLADSVGNTQNEDHEVMNGVCIPIPDDEFEAVTDLDLDHTTNGVCRAVPQGSEPAMGSV